MYLHLYNNDAIVFMTFWTHTYSPHKIAYIVTYRNDPSLSASVAMVFLSFLNTNNISEYPINPVVTEVLYYHNFSTRPPTTIIHHTLQHIIHFTHTSFTAYSSIHTNFSCALIYIFLPKGLKKISASTLTRVSRYRPFIMNGL